LIFLKFIKVINSLQGFKVVLGPYTLPFKEVNTNIVDAIQALVVDQMVVVSEPIDAIASSEPSVELAKKKGSKRKRSKA
jgi:hypothetical protein